MNCLVDTNIIGELCRRKPDGGVLRWAERVQRHAVSAVSVEEIWFGISRRPSSRLHAWMSAYLQSQDILPITDSIARRAGELRGELAGRGLVRTQADMLIAASAQLHGLTLVTRNSRDFEGCGIGLLNPFSP